MLNYFRRQSDLFYVLRPHQWTKNLVVFLPLIIIKNNIFLGSFFRGVEIFCVFCCAASLVYILNDLFDFKHDRLNPSKLYRPIAANRLSSTRVAITLGFLCVLLFYLLWGIEITVSASVGLYILGNIVYSTLAKKTIFFDLLLIAIFFHLRLYAGAQHISIQLSYLFYSVGLFSFLGLAALKRYIEISKFPKGVPGRAYKNKHQKAVSILGLTCAAITTVFLVILLRDAEIVSIYRNSALLVVLVPLFIGEIGLLIIKARTNKLSEDLTMLWRNDLASQLFFVTVILTLALAR